MDWFRLIRFAALSLLLASCSGTSKPKEAQGPVASSPTPQVVAHDFSLDPVREGDKLVFRDPSYPYSISFTEDFYFNANPELLKRAIETGKEMTGGGAQEYDLSNVGLRFTLVASPPGSVEFNPNLTAVVEEVPESAGFLTNKQYAEVAKGLTKRALKAEIVGELERIEIEGTEFYKCVYHFQPENLGYPLRVEAYIRYDSNRRLGYSFGIGSKVEGQEAEIERLRIPLMTISLSD